LEAFLTYNDSIGLSRDKSTIFAKPMNNRRKKSKGTIRHGKATPGPKPEVLRIEGNWREAVKKSLAKKKPLQGWPK